MIFSIIILSALIVNSVIIILIRKRRISFRINAVIYIVSIVVLLTGIFLVIWQNIEINNELDKRNWNTTDGEIIQSEIVGERAIRAEVKYQYVINDSVYFGSSDYHFPGFGSKNYRRKNARIVQEDNPVGKKIKVFYNPEDPSISCLRYGPYYSNYLIIGFGSLLILAGMFITELRLFNISIKKTGEKE